MSNPQIAKLIAAINVASMEDIINAHPRAFEASATINAILMATLENHEQVVALAITLAVLHAACVPETCEADKDGIVTTQDRLDIFMATYRIAYADALRINAEVAKTQQKKGTH